MKDEADRDRDRDHRKASGADLDARATPGRSARSASLRAPASPLPSGILAAGGGAELPETLRSKFESSLGTDLSDVRVHTGADSAQAAGNVGARAFAYGSNIHFGAGQYDPQSSAGQHLLAHEVAHTVQQRGGSPAAQFKLAVSQRGDTHELEADRAASAMVAGERTSVSPGAVVIARQEEEPRSFTDRILHPLDAIDEELERRIPEPLEWGALVNGLGGEVAGGWSDGPAFSLAPITWLPKVLEGKNRFRADWAAAQATWNVVAPMKANMEARIAEAGKTGVTDLAEVHQAGATKSVKEAMQFHEYTDDEGTQRKMSMVDRDLDKIDEGNIPPELKKEIAKAKLDVADARASVQTAGMEIQQALIGVNSAKDAAKSAAIGVTIAKNEEDMAGWEADMEQLEEWKSGVSTALQIGSVGFSAVTDPTAIPEALSGVAESMFDTAIASYKVAIAKAAAVNASGRVRQATIEVTTKLREIESTLIEVEKKNLAFKTAVRSWDKTHIDLSDKVEQAALATTKDPELAARVQAAIQAMPLIEDVVTITEEVFKAIDLPGYSEASGLGAAVCGNVTSFIEHAGALSGLRPVVLDETTQWGITLAGLQAFVKRIG